MKNFSKYFIGLLIVALAACDKEGEVPADVGKDYFPLQKGHYQIYTIDEIRYSEVAAPETLAYELMTEVVDSFPQQGGYTYIVHRSTRANSGAPWQFLDTWSVRAESRELVIAEGNVSFVKMVFPVKAGNTWDGNKFNTQEEDEYEMTSVGEPFTVNDITFSQSLTINQNDNGDLIVFQDKRSETYARDVGLIFKESVQLNYCTTPSCLGKQIVDSGVIYKQSIKEYGRR
ncbi:MAG: hypothetical protein ACOYXT_20230 [Bacteroidota bacterium]